jgi:quinol monooxygenase YgiN
MVTQKIYLTLALVAMFTVVFFTSSVHAQPVPVQLNPLQIMNTTDQNLYGRTGTIKAKEGSANELAAILLKAADLVSNMDGCRLYIIGRDVNNASIIWVYEIWESKMHHAKSLQREEVRVLISKAMPLIDSIPDGGVEMEILGGAGIQ